MIFKPKAFRADSGRRAGAAGLTILEMLVSSAMLALIIVGLTAMFVQTQKAFKSGIKQTDVGDAGRSIADLMANDLSQLSDGQPYAVSNRFYGVTNLLWGWDGVFPQYEDGHAFRTNLLQGVYMLVQTNSGWTGVGYVVSNLVPGLGVGTLYRYTAPTNAHFLDNLRVFTPFNAVFQPNFSNSTYFINPAIRLSRVADGVVHLRIIPYDTYGYPTGYETNVGKLYMSGPVTNTYPYSSFVTSPTPHMVNNNLPASVDLELGILDPDAWEHLRGLAGNLTAQSNYLNTAAAKVDIFRKRILVRAANLP